MADNETLPLLLLPGLDGTGKLFTRFVEHLPANIAPRVVPLPKDRPRGYADLVASMRQHLPVRRRFACPVPLLYLSGSDDRLLRRALVREMSECQPALKHWELAAPHLVLQRRPREAAKLVSDFLGRATGDPHSAGGAGPAPA